jgi:hypothetical protein
VIGLHSELQHAVSCEAKVIPSDNHIWLVCGAIVKSKYCRDDACVAPALVLRRDIYLEIFSFSFYTILDWRLQIFTPMNFNEGFTNLAIALGWYKPHEQYLNPWVELILNEN